MPMNFEERQRIEYHPRLGIAVRVQTVIDRAVKETEYNVPTEILEAVNNTVTDALTRAVNTLAKADDLLSDLESDLKDTVTNGIAFSDYLKEKQNDGDYDTISAWEDANTLDVNGSMKGDVYPTVVDARENIVDYINLLNDTVVVGDVYQDDLESLEAAEARQLENLVKNDIAKSDISTLRELKMQNELLDTVNGALDAIDAFLDDTKEVTSLTVDDLFRNNIESVVSTLATGDSDKLDKLSRLSEIGFAQVAGTTQDIKQRTTRIKETNDVVHAEVKEFMGLVKDAGDILDWMGSFETDYDESAITEVMRNTLLSVTSILDGYDAVIGDMHKTNEMASMQYNDLVGNLYIKEGHRQQHHVTNDVNTKLNVSSANADQQINRFVKSMGYK